MVFSRSKPRIEQHKEEKRQAYKAKGHGNGQVLIMCAKAILLLQRRMNLIIGLTECLWHITRTHTEPRMLTYEVQRSPRELDTLRERASVRVVVFAIKAVLKQGRRETGPQAGMLPVVVVGHPLLDVMDILVGQDHDTLRVLAQTFRGEITGQCRL